MLYNYFQLLPVKIENDEQEKISTYPSQKVTMEGDVTKEALNWIVLGLRAFGQFHVVFKINTPNLLKEESV